MQEFLYYGEGEVPYGLMNKQTNSKVKKNMFEDRLQTLSFKHLREPRLDIDKEMGQKILEPLLFPNSPFTPAFLARIHSL